MTNTEMKSLQAREKTEVSSPIEQTRPGLVFNPAVDIYETDKELTLLADVPGVKAENLNIDLRDSVLTLSAEVAMPEGDKEIDVFREYQTGKYFREFSLSEAIDQSKIDAELKDGVLKLKLPKAEAARPRKISVKSS
ncbi:MAG: Hsp20/alpha crystallin family protein [Deltaproteobacteria bacterium]|nr:Hsp20/alpha crystallin family protein [Deltaproteobacteria bacterium]